MATIEQEIEYKCFDDCRQWGCPGHKIKITIQTVSEALIVYRDDTFLFGADPNEWRAIKRAIENTNYVQFNS
jgi:hypothetical protein